MPITSWNAPSSHQIFALFGYDDDFFGVFIDIWHVCLQNYCKIMPVVETRHYNGIYQSVSTKLLAKQGKKGAKNEVC